MQPDWQTLTAAQLSDDLSWLNDSFDPSDSSLDSLLNIPVGNENKATAIEEPIKDDFNWFISEEEFLGSNHSESRISPPVIEQNPLPENIIGQHNSTPICENDVDSNALGNTKEEEHGDNLPQETHVNKDGDFWRSLLETESSEGSGHSVAQVGDSNGTLASGVSVPMDLVKGGWLLDMKKSSEKDFCFPQAQDTSRDESAIEIFRSNGLNFIQRQIDLPCLPIHQNHHSSQGFNLPEAGCHCQSCILPKFDFNLKDLNGQDKSPATELISPTAFAKPIIIAPTSAKKRPADMSARLAALVTATTSKPSVRPAILDRNREIPSKLFSDSENSGFEANLKGRQSSGSGRGRLKALSKRTAADGTVRPANLGNDKVLMRAGMGLSTPSKDSLLDEELVKKQLISLAEAIAMDDQVKY